MKPSSIQNYNKKNIKEKQKNAKKEVQLRLLEQHQYKINLEIYRKKYNNKKQLFFEILY